MYWLSSQSYAPGSVIGPGNWGRIISSYLIGVRSLSGRHAERLPMAVREMIFECVRHEVNPALPSRFSSFFLCPDLRTAVALRTQDAPARNHEILYEVALTESEAPVFEGNMLLATLEVGDTVETIRDKAARYWRGADGGVRESLTPSGIRIERQISPGELVDRISESHPRRLTG